MLLVEARVTNFKSIDDSGPVAIDEDVTVLVGQNESGKTAFLQALEKSQPVRKGIAFDPIEDYPRKALNEYLKRHANDPAPVVLLTYQLNDDEVAAVNKGLGADALRSDTFSMQYSYKGGWTLSLPVHEPSIIKSLIATSGLTKELKAAAGKAVTLRNMIEVLEGSDRNAEADAFLRKLKERFETALETKWSLGRHEAWYEHIGVLPKFLYFGDYQLLPGKVNLPNLKTRVANTAQLTEDDETVLRLLKMASVELDDILEATGYEQAKARLEGLSNTITDEIFKYWSTNQELDVEFDIKPDPEDVDPAFRKGPNLYIRIKNRRHRVTVPFSQRSKGFIWFFSFIVWFNSVRDEGGALVILLLDEPGLSLHALAQADLLRYIDDLAGQHQIIYTTHSPFMVHGDRLSQVRLVEDRLKGGTMVSDNIMGSDPRTIFPLQAALGYTIAQNLFISKKNLLVEGPSDLIYLQFMSSQLEVLGRTGLREDVTIVPTGGLDKVATFIALLNANELEMVVLHDRGSQPEARLESMVREKVIKDKQLLNFGMFRDGKGTAEPATDIEDLFAPAWYLQLFNGAYTSQLGATDIKVGDLPLGDRIVERIERHLRSSSINVRPSGGFNHYLPARHLASTKAPKLDAATLDRFEKLFKTVNGLF